MGDGAAFGVEANPIRFQANRSKPLARRPFETSKTAMTDQSIVAMQRALERAGVEVAIGGQPRGRLKAKAPL
jgi:hypothetical protein